MEQPDTAYREALAGEGAYWDNFIAQRLLRGEMPGSIDWRLTFTQFRYNHKWLPFCLGPHGINFRLQELRDILTTVTPRPGMRILDLGCGAGWLSLELARRGAHVTGMDISPTNLALARYMAATNARNFPFLYQGFAGLPCRLEDFGSVEYLFADLNTVTLPANEYDAIVVWDSLHHVSSLERLLEQVRGALKPAGVFIGLDHAFATPRTEVFNLAFLPWVDDLYAWITRTDPQWLYTAVAAAARQHNWGVLAVDDDPTPVPNFGPFSEQLFAEMLEILRAGLREEALAKAQTEPSTAEPEEESPFEDVSAERVMQVLLDSFTVLRFNTIAPLIQPERHIPHYRTEPERIFQHYLAAALTRLGERAIARGQADGQWFLFHLTRDRPTQVAPHLQFLRDAANTPTMHEKLLTGELDERAAYIAQLEAELARKNAALLDLQTRLQHRESELIAARAPRLPWKRRTGGR